MFSIRVLPESEVGAEGERLGEITVGDFRERFACFTSDDSLAQMQARWRSQLEQLVEGAEFALLKHDERVAWMVYRENSTCYIQQVLSPDGSFSEHTIRRTVTDEGHVVSEWKTNVDEISWFLRA